MILCDYQITARCHGGMVSPFDPELVNPASLDVRVGDMLLIESAASPELVPYPLHHHTEAEPYLLRPGQFVLAHTVETFQLPEDLAVEFKLKSSRAREGWDHAAAGFCDPGWYGSKLTMELKNNRQLHSLPMWPGMLMGQMIFHCMVSSPQRSYAVRGRYNQDNNVQGSKG